MRSLLRNARLKDRYSRGLALRFLSNLARELSRGPVDLPCFPNVVIRIRDALKDPNPSIDATVTLVGAEPLGQRLVQGTAMAFAMQYMKEEPKLRTIAKPLQALWKKSVAVASICQLVARRTKAKPDEAFLTGLLHGIGRLSIMAHAVGKPDAVIVDLESEETIGSWHPSIGKAVLENWQVGEAMAESVGQQCAMWA